MTWLPEWLAFAGLMALGQFSPGPDMLLLTRVALAEGRRAGWLVAAGIVTGLCLHAALAIGGMAYLLEKGGWLEGLLRWSAAAYLLWLAVGLFRAWFCAACGANSSSEVKVEDGRGWYLQGLFCNVLNPKVVVFFAGMVAAFLKGNDGVWWPLVMWLTIVVEGLVLWGLWVVVLQEKRVRRAYQRYAVWLNLAFSMGLAVMAISLIWDF